MRSVSALLLNEMLQKQAPIQLIDMREPEQFENYHIKGAMNIPIREIKDQTELINPKVLVIIYCSFGAKSEHIANYLRDTLDSRNICHLQGGLYEWYKEIDPTAPF